MADNEKLVKAFKEKAKQIALNRKDIRFKKTIGFMKAKGLLDTNLPIVPTTSIRLDINDVIWAAKNVEPRIIEVLPAAILHFPRNFLGLNRMPKELRDVIEHVKRNAEVGPDYEGLEYRKMKFWANIPLKDKRTRPIKQKRQSKLFRLRPETLEKLRRLVESKKFVDQTSALEAAVEKLSLD